jgi:superfamily II DNA or RNA helicase
LKAQADLDFSITDIAPVFDSVSLKEAERNGWVSNFTVYNLAVPLSQKDQKEYEAINNKYMKYFSTFEFDFEMAMNALKDKGLRERIARRLNWEEKVVMLHALGYNRSMRERKTFLYTTESLIRTAAEIAKRFSDRKIITFSESTMAADKLTDLLPDSASYHSQLQTVFINGKKKGPATRKKEAMKNFSEDKIRVLNTARALNVGADIPNVDMSIICSFNSSLIDSIQRTGRAVRYAEGKHAIEVNLYIPKAQSEKWLRSKQKKTPNVKWITSMDQIV